MEYVKSTLIISGIIAILAVIVITPGISFAGEETFTQLRVIFKSCEKVEANKTLSLPLYEEAISHAKAEVEFLRRIGGVSQTCLFSLDRFAMSHGDACIGRFLEEDMLQRSRRAVPSSLRKTYYDISTENRGIAEDAQKEATKNLVEAYKSCLPQRYD